MRKAQKATKTGTVENVFPNSHSLLTKREKALIELVNGMISKHVGYTVRIPVYLIDKFPDASQLGSINFEIGNGKVFAIDIYMTKGQKRRQRIFTLLHELGHCLDYHTLNKKMGMEFAMTQDSTTDIDVAAGILFEAEKRAWYNAILLADKSGIGTKRFMVAMFKDKYDSLEAAIDDSYETLKQQRKPEKKDTEKNGPATECATAPERETPDSGSGSEDGQPNSPGYGTGPRFGVNAFGVGASGWPRY